jgi:hypothetical protein
VQGNWTLSDKTRLYSTLDYRKSPLLLTSNAIRAASPLETIEEVNEIATEDEIYDLAETATTETSTLLFGASHPLSETLQISGDVTITSTSDSDGVGNSGDPIFLSPVDETGTQYFYNFQLIKNDLLKRGDIGILSLRFQDASNSDTFRVGVSSRYPVTNLFRVNPRFDISYRKTDDTDNTRLTLSPYLRMDYRLRKSFTLEFDGGINWYKEDTAGLESKTTDYFIMAGYRWDF